MTSDQPDARPEIKFHDEIAHKWETLHRSPAFRRRTRAMFALIDGQPLAGSTWIDCGCGTGTLSHRLASQGSNVTGFDASEEMIEIASRATTDGPIPHQPSFHLIETIEQLPLDNATCDGVLCASVLEYTASPERCIAEFSRVMRPDGLLLVSIPNRLSMLRRFFRTAYLLSTRFTSRPVFRYFEHSTFEASIDEITALLQRQGLTVLDHNFAGSPLPAWLDSKAGFGTLINVLARRHLTLAKEP